MVIVVGAERQVGGQTIRIEIAYDGTEFWGFARQPDRETVESVLRARIEPLVPDLRRFAVGGRTDRGVNAVGQVVSFKTRRRLDLEALVHALNPPGEGRLIVRDVRRVQNRFDAQNSARGRRYAYFWPQPEDFPLQPRLQRLLLPLVGRHDFFAFARDTPRGAPTTKRLVEASVRMAAIDEQPALRFDLAAEGFLRRQVRVLVATALREARANAPEARLFELLRARERIDTAKPAPPEGLFLVKIVY